MAFQSLDLRGEKRQGRIDCSERFKLLGITDLTNKSVLDIGCSLGGCCIESKKMGAAEVIGIDNDNDSIICAKKIAEYNEMNIKYEVIDLNKNASSNQLSKQSFDYVYTFAIFAWIKRVNIITFLKGLDFKTCLIESKKKLKINFQKLFDDVGQGFVIEEFGDSTEKDRKLCIARKR